MTTAYPETYTPPQQWGRLYGIRKCQILYSGRVHKDKARISDRLDINETYLKQTERKENNQEKNVSSFTGVTLTDHSGTFSNTWSVKVIKLTGNMFK